MHKSLFFHLFTSPIDVTSMLLLCDFYVVISVAVFRGNGRSVHCYIGVSEQNVSLKIFLLETSSTQKITYKGVRN